MNEQQTLEFHITQHPARCGWEVVRIAYDARNATDSRAIDAALVALRAARHEQVDVREKESAIAS